MDKKKIEISSGTLLEICLIALIAIAGLIYGGYDIITELNELKETSNSYEDVVDYSYNEDEEDFNDLSKDKENDSVKKLKAKSNVRISSSNKNISIFEEKDTYYENGVKQVTPRYSFHDGRDRVYLTSSDRNIKMVEKNISNEWIDKNLFIKGDKIPFDCDYSVLEIKLYDGKVLFEQKVDYENNRVNLENTYLSEDLETGNYDVFYSISYYKNDDVIGKNVLLTILVVENDTGNEKDED